MRVKGFLLAALPFLFIITSAPAAKASTLWAAAGERVADKGVLIAKNFDAEPGRKIELKFFSSAGNLRFVGIDYSTGLEENIEAGVNEKGLVVAVAIVESIAKAERQIGAAGLAKKLLASFASVDEVLGNRALLQSSRPAFYLVADNKKIALIEIALRGQVNVEFTDNGCLAHTNHYTSDQLKYGNQKVYKDSRARLARIGELMSERTEALTLDDFKVFSQDKQDGPEDSIFKTGGSAFAEKTLATWIVSLAQSGEPLLYARLMDSAAGERVVNVTLDESFWNKGRF